MHFDTKKKGSRSSLFLKGQFVIDYNREIPHLNKR